MIQEDYCSYEAAKLLKEKGFNEDCKAYYEDGKFCWIWNDGCSRNTDNPKYVSCPSQALAMKWLREVHNIHIAIDRGIEHYFVILTKLKPYQDLTMKKDVFDTFEEAVEAAIKYSLENLRESGDSFVIDYLIEHESDSKNYHLYLRSYGRGLSDYVLSEEECLKLYNALKITLELENLV